MTTNHSEGGTTDKEDFKILTAWIEVNHPNKPALREPVQCIRLSTYEQTVRVLVAARSALVEKERELEIQRQAKVDAQDQAWMLSGKLEAAEARAGEAEKERKEKT